jgi:acetoacetyl-CoA synthetase
MMSKDGMATPYVPQISLYRQWLRDQRGLSFSNYEEMRQWSVSDIDAFWQSIWDYFDLQSPTPHHAVLAQRKMPGAVWFPGAQVNYARQVMRHVAAADAAGQPAIVSSGEDGVLKETSWPELRRKVAALAINLRGQGVGSGDRVAAYLPNIPETSLHSSRPQASVRYGASAPPTWRRPPSSIASSRLNPRC